jgi:hypothetical protein
MTLTEERQYGAMSSVKKEEDEESSWEKEMSRRPKKRLRRWRYAMELPCHGKDWEKLWNFVAAHVEDDSRKKPCSLAVKAWQRVCKLEKVPYRERTDEGILPSVMPSFRQVKSGESKAKW